MSVATTSKKQMLFSLIPLLVSVSTAAKRVGVTDRAIRALIERKRITSFIIADVHIIYWPSVASYYRSRNIYV